jgi:3-oxoacyl-[acyl-carrier-protein] synthase II
VELRGWASGSEAHHITNPEPSGATAASVMRQALRRAEMSPAEVDYVNAHGTATRLNDAMEAAAIRACFGEEGDRVLVSSTKGQLGHTLGAAGAVEAILTAMSVARGVVPPTVGLDAVDPDCRLHHVREAQPAEVAAAMSNSFGFGGSDVVLLFATPRGSATSGASATPGRQPVFVTGAGMVGPLGTGSSAAARDYLDDGAAPPDGPIDFDDKALLDLGRARRLDRAARLTAAAVDLAIEEAGWDEAGRAEAGAALGGAFGAVDACSAFLHRVYEKGARFASPAVFPNLLPSSAVAQAAIYHRLRGPVLATADLEASAESALVTAVELLAAGEASKMVAGGVEPNSAIAEAVLGPVCEGERLGDHEPRSEGAAVVLLESAESLDAGQGRALAEVVWSASWREDHARETLSAMPEPDVGAALFLGRADTGAIEALAGTPWSEVPRSVLSKRVGRHESVGGFALVAAVAALVEGRAKNALVVGASAGGGAALLLRRPARGSSATPDASFQRSEG